VDTQGLVQLRSPRAAQSVDFRTIGGLVGMGFLLTAQQFFSNVSESRAGSVGLPVAMCRCSTVQRVHLVAIRLVGLSWPRLAYVSAGTQPEFVADGVATVGSAVSMRFARGRRLLS
jgi:hypothetical protein